MKKPMTILDVLCQNFGWQGGTIHNAIAHFATLPKNEQENCYNAITRFANLSRDEQEKCYNDLMDNLTNIKDNLDFNLGYIKMIKDIYFARVK